MEQESYKRYVRIVNKRIDDIINVKANYFFYYGTYFWSQHSKQQAPLGRSYIYLWCRSYEIKSYSAASKIKLDRKAETLSEEELGIIRDELKSILLSEISDEKSLQISRLFRIWIAIEVSATKGLPSSWTAYKDKRSYKTR